MNLTFQDLQKKPDFDATSPVNRNSQHRLYDSTAVPSARHRHSRLKIGPTPPNINGPGRSILSCTSAVGLYS